jgi:flavodoxin
MRTLVVYYSRTGTTRAVALAIAQALGADVEEIVDRTPRSGIVGYLRSGLESSLARSTPIQRGARDPRDYDLVVVGTPVWVANVCSPVRAYLTGRQGLAGKVAFFCTMGGRGNHRAFRSMEAACGAPPLARLALRERVGWREGQEAIADFVAAATAAVAAAQPRPAGANHGKAAEVQAAEVQVP